MLILINPLDDPTLSNLCPVVWLNMVQPSITARLAGQKNNRPNRESSRFARKFIMQMSVSQWAIENNCDLMNRDTRLDLWPTSCWHENRDFRLFIPQINPFQIYRYSFVFYSVSHFSTIHPQVGRTTTTFICGRDKHAAASSPGHEGIIGYELRN